MKLSLAITATAKHVIDEKQQDGSRGGGGSVGLTCYTPLRSKLFNFHADFKKV